MNTLMHKKKKKKKKKNWKNFHLLIIARHVYMFTSYTFQKVMLLKRN